LLLDLDFEAVEKVTQLLLDKERSGQTIFLAGNGGSAATASHFVIDLLECSRPEDGVHFKAVCLSDNTPSLTALGNDLSYQEVFAGQMRVLFGKGDVLVVISASGNSPNVVEAARLGKELGGVTVGLLGFDGGKLARICDHVIVVATDKGEYGPVEDIHLVLDHMITSYLRLKLGVMRK